MPSKTTLTVCLTDTLREFVEANVGENGTYVNATEYVRDLIRRDKERSERDAFGRLKAELTSAFSEPDDSYHPLPNGFKKLGGVDSAPP